MSAAAELLFQRLLRSLKPPMEASGFRRKSQNFICETPECWGVVNFQKSRYSPQGKKSFTVNLAIASKRILEYHGKSTSAPPPSYACHWVDRIGSLMSEHHDKWWTLSDEGSYISVESEVKKALTDSVLPLIKLHLTEQGLLDLWASNTAGTFEYPTLKCKSILLALQHRFDELPEIFWRIREICHPGTAGVGAEEHITKLKKHFSLSW
jgi:Domain of unknown function (DUF4304)